jgi:hypothetical protein
MSGAALPLPRHLPVALVFLALAAAFALAVGLAIGDSGSGMLLPVGVVLGLAVVATVMVRPFVGFVVLVFSLFLLIVVRIPDTARGVNAFDLTLFPVLFASWFGSAHRTARAEDVLLAGPSHDAIRSATRRFTLGVLLYFGLAALSLAPMAFRIGPRPAIISGLSLFRALQGASIYLLGMWWLRDDRRIEWALRAAFASAVVFVAVNAVWVFGLGVPRAGIVWWVTETREAIGSPNEAGIALVVLWALAKARYAVRPGWWLVVLMAFVFVMLPLTQSRSGLLAFATFLLLTVRHVRWRWVLGSLLALGTVLMLVPASFWTRMERTVAFRQGSPEVFAFLLRVYSYRMAWRVFLDHPLLGVGYLGYRFMSARYTEFNLVGLVAENFLLETLAGLGIVGLALVVLVFSRLWRLCREVERATAAGTLGHEMARLSPSLLVAMFVANLTGSTVVGIVGVGQLALWTALLVRSGHLAVSRAET